MTGPRLRIAYVLNWEGGPDSGPFKKVVEQARVWTGLGADVGLFVFTTEQNVRHWCGVEQTVHVELRSPNPLTLLKRKGRLLKAALAWRPDLVYHRYTLAYPALVAAVRRVRVVVEVNTNDLVEYDLLSRRRGRVNRLTRGLVLRRAAGLAFVTRELAEDPAFVRFERPSVVVANGVDLEAYPPSPAVPRDTTSLVFIGGPGCPWHGLDKVLWLAHRHPEWAFEIIGDVRAELGVVPPNVRLHGALTEAEYLPLLSSADVGIGSLALHRKAMIEASPLKVREYLACGVPCIIAYEDTDFPEGAPFLLRVANTDDGVVQAESEIVSFVERWRGHRVPRQEIVGLDVRQKEVARLRFLESLVGERPNRSRHVLA